MKKKRKSWGMLKFQLPEDKDLFIDAQNGTSYSILLFDLDNWLRDMIKYELKNSISIQEVRDKINELKDEYNIK